MMEYDTSATAIASGRPRLYGIVQTYIQKQLPRDIHPAFKALRDREEAAITSPQIPCTEDPTSPLLEQRGSRIDPVLGDKDDDGGDDDDDLSLYANFQGPSFPMIDSAQRRVIQGCCE